jgi:hypothetical protein
MSGSRLLLTELAADLRSYLIQNGKSSLVGSVEMAKLFPKQRKGAYAQAPAFMPSARPQAAPHPLPQKKVIAENVPIPQPQQPKPLPQPVVQPKAVPKIIQEEAKTVTPVRAAPTPQLKKYLSENASSLRFLEQTPDDKEARAIRSRWLLEQMAVAVLVSAQGEDEERFIQAVAKGINERLAPAYFPGRELPPHYLSWEELLANPALRLILTTRSFLLSDPTLRKGCSGTTQEPLLFGKPLLILDPLSHYLSAPKQKADLWERIKRAFQG